MKNEHSFFFTLLHMQCLAVKHFRYIHFVNTEHDSTLTLTKERPTALKGVWYSNEGPFHPNLSVTAQLCHTQAQAVKSTHNKVWYMRWMCSYSKKHPKVAIVVAYALTPIPVLLMEQFAKKITISAHNHCYSLVPETQLTGGSMYGRLETPHLFYKCLFS